MTGFTLVGVVLAVMGALLMSVDNFFFIFANTKKQAKQEFKTRYNALAPDNAQQEKEIDDIRKEMVKRKIIMVIGFITLIVGLCLQVLGIAD
jgi:hypothetical protein